MTEVEVNPGCLGESAIDEYVAIALDIIAVAIILVIARHASHSFSALENVNTTLQILFFIAVISSILVLVSSIGSVLVCILSTDQLSAICTSIAFGGYSILFSCIWCTLIYRLHTTFEGTTYAMSGCARGIFQGLFVLEMVILLSDVSIEF